MRQIATDQDFRLLNRDELSRTLGIPKSWLEEKTRKGRSTDFPFLKIGRYVRYDPEKVLAWFEKNQETRCK